MASLLTTTNRKGETVVSLRGWIIIASSALAVGNGAVLTATMIIGGKPLGWRIFELATCLAVLVLYAGEPVITRWRKGRHGYPCCEHCHGHVAPWFGSETLRADGKGHTEPCAHCG